MKDTSSSAVKQICKFKKKIKPRDSLVSPRHGLPGECEECVLGDVVGELDLEVGEVGAVDGDRLEQGVVGDGHLQPGEVAGGQLEHGAQQLLALPRPEVGLLRFLEAVPGRRKY